MDVDNMLAGREMDMLIAEYIFGWKNLRWKDGGRKFDELGQIVSWPTGWYGDGPGGKTYLTKNYSTDMGDAWEIVEHLDDEDIILSFFDCLGYDMDEARKGTSVVKRMWRVEFMDNAAHEADRPRDEIWFGPEQAPTAPLAICRAALRVAMK